jgi:hypothetical protein
MALVHGQHITAENIERHSFSPKDFASLCNAITWALSERRCTSLPSFTERINVKDGGIDAEWDVELPKNESSPLLGSGWNVFQYKWRDINASDRTTIFSNLKNGLKGAVAELYKRTNRRPDKYVVFSNLDLTHFTEAQNASSPQKGELKESILEGYDQSDSVRIEVVGAAELAVFLNDLPHIRSSYFSTSSFMTWQKAWLNERSYGANTALIGRDKELDDLRSFVENPDIRVITLSGTQGIGKTRLALEATDHQPLETVIALDPISMNVTDLLNLQSPNLETLVIIDDPDLQKAEKFTESVLASTGLKVLITLPTSENAPLPHFGLDSRVKNFSLASLLEEQSKQLLRDAGTDFDYGIESWVVKQAGGNPGILLQAVAISGRDFRQHTDNFIDTISSALEQKIRHRFNDDEIRILKLLSLLSFVGTEGRVNQEIELICQVFGDGLSPNAVQEVIERLKKAGLVRMKGIYAEVLPPLFANYLAANLLQNRKLQLLIFFAKLSQDGQSRLIQRLRELKPVAIDWFWDEMFSSTGLFRDLSSLLSHGRILRLVVCAVPYKVAKLVSELESRSLEELRSIQDSERDTLVWVLEELIFREQTSLQALRYLKLLAETDIENNRIDNASSKFCQCFQPLHPQIPIPIQRRLEFLETFFKPTASTESHLLGIKVIQTVLNRYRHAYLHEGSGAQPVDARPTMTWKDVWDFQQSLLNLLMKQVDSEKSIVAEAAKQAVPKVISEFAMLQFSPDVAIENFQTTVNWVLSHKVGISVSQVSDALASVHIFYTSHSAKADEKTVIKCKEFLEKINVLINKLDKADFAIRLKQWTGHWTIKHDDNDSEPKILAQEAIKQPELLTDELLSWLCSKESQEAWSFCHWLGRFDTERRWLSKIEVIGAQENGLVVFSAYFGGLGQIDRSFVSDRLDELAESNEVKAEAIVLATRHLGGDLRGVERLVNLIQQKRANPANVAIQLKGGGWIKSLSQGEFLQILQETVGSEMENTAAAIDLFSIWLHNQRSIDGELAKFAWTCLEANNTINKQREADRIACQLVQSDIEKGFSLFIKLLLQPISNQCWNPIDHFGQNEFWKALYSENRNRAVNAILSSAVGEFSYGSVNFSDIAKAVDQERDSDLLIEFALEDENQALLVCNCLLEERNNFWSIAFQMIEKYPSNHEITGILSKAILWNYWQRYHSDYLEKCIEEIKQRINSSDTPYYALNWLDELRAHLDDRAERESNSGTETSNAKLKTWTENLDNGQIWAIQTLLDTAEIQEINRYISRQEFLALLPKINLTESAKDKSQQILQN